MNELIRCLKSLSPKLDQLRKDAIKETPTRVIFIDPVLEALGWDVRDPDVVQMEYPTVDGKSVDYALKINRKAVLLVEAKALGSSLDDVKSITQVVGYAANDGIVWCVLTNGVQWRVYRSIEKCPAPQKLMYEVSCDPRDSEGMSIEDIAALLWRLSRGEMAKGTLDDLGEQAFTDEKVRKALGRILAEPPRSVLNVIRAELQDDAVTPRRIKESLARIWKDGLVPPGEPEMETAIQAGPSVAPSGSQAPEDGRRTRRPRGTTTPFPVLESWVVEELRKSPGPRKVKDVLVAIEEAQSPFLTEADRLPQKGHEGENTWMYRCRWAITRLRRSGVLRPDSARGSIELSPEAPQKLAETRKRQEYDENRHTQDKPREVVQLYREIDRFCFSLKPGEVERRYRSVSINYSVAGKIFCCVHLQRSGLRLWLRLKYDRLGDPPDFARDVTNIGHYGAGDLELAITDPSQLPTANALIRQSLGE